MNKDIYETSFNSVLQELSNPSERLESIRKQLFTGFDLNGNPLELVEVNLDEATTKFINELCERYMVTFEEVCWLILSTIVEAQVEE